MKQFNASTFFFNFEIALRAIREAERITKDTLRSLSRELLMQIHYESKLQGDIQPANRLLEVLSPMNRKTFVLFMQEFSGFNFDEETGLFGKKNKKEYDARCKLACESLDDPHFNLWTWAERNVKVEKKRFKLETLSKDVKRALEEEGEDGKPLYSKADVVKTILEGGLSIDDLILIMQEMGELDIKVEV
jgi:hypothetical protein